MLKTILTIGAYERDNFGDALFFVVLDFIAHQRDIELVPGSVMGSDMREYFGKYVFPYNFLLERYQFDAMWVVGGEIGVCDISMAFPMSIEKNFFSRYDALLPEIKKTCDTFLSGITSHQLAYLPFLETYIKNKKTPLVVNSVGGFQNLEQFHEDTICKSTLDILRSAKVVSVRSEQSHLYLNSQGVQNTLIPDSVHAISLLYKPVPVYQCSYVVFQLKERLCDSYGIEVVAKNIVDIVNKYGMPVYLFAAGTANHHDSLAKYEEIQKYAREVFNENRIEIIYEKNSLKRVDIIAHAHIWIGSSLHGRIVAMSYNIPRVSFFSEKVSEYSKLWDSQFPYNTTLETLLDSCDKALAIDHISMAISGKALAGQAVSNIHNIFDTIYVR
jgi:hypothetical protein